MRPLRAAARLGLMAIIALSAGVLSSAGEPSAAEQQATSSEETDNAQWEVLFDGQSLAKWRSYGQAEVHPHWQIEDGALVLTQADGGDLITRATYQNFELYLEWWVAAGGNSGIFVLADESQLPIYVRAPEVQILDDAAHRDGNFADKRSGSLYDLIAAPAAAQKPTEHWNSVRIRHDNGHLQVWQNDVKTADVVIGSDTWKQLVADSKFADWAGFGANPSGFIGLQDHGNRVAFRNLKIRRLHAHLPGI